MRDTFTLKGMLVVELMLLTSKTASPRLCTPEQVLMLYRDFYNYHMSKSATKQQPLFHLTPENPESQMPQMLLTDVSI